MTGQPVATKRQLLGSVALLLSTAGTAWADGIGDLESRAFEAYANRDFQQASNLLTQIINMEADPATIPRWYEMRAQVLVDGKNFQAALTDFGEALSKTGPEALTDRARLLAGRALAYEGVSDWKAALADYQQAMDLAALGGESPDPYVVNSMGNVYASMGMWREAREAYLGSSQLFQQAKGFRGRGGSTTQRLDGAVFAASNAALMLAQMGDEEGAVKEMARIARRAPGSVDMRAALAALYYHQGLVREAEDEWEFACDKITVGCSKYQDVDWLTRVRRWPPVMAARMQAFLKLDGAGLGKAVL